MHPHERVLHDLLAGGEIPEQEGRQPDERAVLVTVKAGEPRIAGLRLHRDHHHAQLTSGPPSALTRPHREIGALSHPVHRFGRVLLVSSCPVCGRRGTAPCLTCAAELRPPPRLPPMAGVDRAAAVLAYDGAGRELVARLKYRNARASLTGLAAAMAAMVDPSSVDVVTWIPTTGARRRARGFDQGRLLATGVARRLRRPRRSLLRRRPGAAQTGLGGRARRLGPRLTARRRVDGLRVLVVDDVITTGASAASAAAALRAVGAATVTVVAAAHTPLKRRRGSDETTGDAGRRAAGGAVPGSTPSGGRHRP